VTPYNRHRERRPGREPSVIARPTKEAEAIFNSPPARSAREPHRHRERRPGRGPLVIARPTKEAEAIFNSHYSPARPARQSKTASALLNAQGLAVTPYNRHRERRPGREPSVIARPTKEAEAIFNSPPARPAREPHRHRERRPGREATFNSPRLPRTAHPPIKDCFGLVECTRPRSDDV
jgi:hypothetical protein